MRNRILAVLFVLSALWGMCFGALAEEEMFLPAGLEVIEQEAFMGDTSLGTVRVPESVRVIGARAFADSSVGEVYLPVSLEEIAGDVFAGCENVMLVVEEESYAYGWAKGSGLEYRLNIDFLYNRYDKDVTISGYIGTDPDVIIPSEIEGLPVVGVSLLNNQVIESIVYPEGTASVGGLTGCGNLKKVELPQSVKILWESAFRGCTALKEINLPEGLTHINACAFEKSGLTRIEIPGGVEVLGDSVLSECTELSEVMLNEGITQIGDFMFYMCPALRQIELPGTLEKIGGHAFGYSGLQEIVIPEGVTELAFQAFWHCSDLESVVLPESISYIGVNAFKDCPGLTVTVPAGSYAQEYCEKNDVPYVTK